MEENDVGMPQLFKRENINKIFNEHYRFRGVNYKDHLDQTIRFYYSLHQDSLNKYTINYYYVGTNIVSKKIDTVLHLPRVLYKKFIVKYNNTGTLKEYTQYTFYNMDENYIYSIYSFKFPANPKKYIYQTYDNLGELVEITENILIE